MHLGTTISPHDTLESILEPLDRLLLVDTVACTNLARGTSSLSYSLTRSCPVRWSFSNWLKYQRGPNTLLDLHAAVKVHAVNTNCRIILDAQINMFTNAKPEVAIIH